MKVNNLDLIQMHNIAKDAVEQMILMTKETYDSLDGCSERQLEHEIGYLLNQHHFWVYFDYRYPEQRGGNNKPRADILAWAKTNKLKTAQAYWIEIKFTSNFHDNLPKSFWQYDFDKLRKPHYNQWSSNHHAYWIWLYLFNNLQDEINAKFGNSQDWKRRMSLNKMSEIVDTNKRLAKLLSAISEESNGSTCSIIPSNYKENYIFSTLLVTAQLKE